MACRMAWPDDAAADINHPKILLENDWQWKLNKICWSWNEAETHLWSSRAPSTHVKHLIAAANGLDYMISGSMQKNISLKSNSLCGIIAFFAFAVTTQKSMSGRKQTNSKSCNQICHQLHIPSNIINSFCTNANYVKPFTKLLQWSNCARQADQVDTGLADSDFSDWTKRARFFIAVHESPLVQYSIWFYSLDFAFCFASKF